MALRFTIALAALVVAAPALAVGIVPVTTASTDVECDPYPVGRCGAYQREEVIFCFKVGYPWGTWISAAESDVEPITWPGVATPAPTPLTAPKSLAYLYHPPSDAFLADPYESDLPFDSIWQETNAAPGLQVKPFKCGAFQWFAECIPQQWMGPYRVSQNPLPADDVIV